LPRVNVKYDRQRAIDESQQTATNRQSANGVVKDRHREPPNDSERRLAILVMLANR